MVSPTKSIPSDENVNSGRLNKSARSTPVETRAWVALLIPPPPCLYFKLLLPSAPALFLMSANYLNSGYTSVRPDEKQIWGEIKGRLRAGHDRTRGCRGTPMFKRWAKLDAALYSICVFGSFAKYHVGGAADVTPDWQFALIAKTAFPSFFGRGRASAPPFGVNTFLKGLSG